MDSNSNFTDQWLGIEGDFDTGAEPAAADEAMCVCRHLLHSQIEAGIHSRPQISLTDEQYSQLRRRISEFKKAKSAAQKKKVIDDTVLFIQTGWREHIAFDRRVVELVSAPLIQVNWIVLTSS